MLSLVLEFLLVVFVIGCSEILHLAIDGTAQESGEFLGYSLLATCTDLTERGFKGATNEFIFSYL